MTVHTRPDERRRDRSGSPTPRRQVDQAGPNTLRALQRQAGNRAVAEALAVQRVKGPASLIGGALRDISFGSAAERTAPPAPQGAPSVGQYSDITQIDPVSKDSTNGNRLIGQHYHGRTHQQHGQPLRMQGKLILFFSGSSGSADEYSREVAREYCSKGADVLAFNYRGFGGSDNTSATAKARRKGATPSEKGLYDDGMAMWNCAIGIAHNAGDVILHGYSLGGAVASHVAKELKQQGVTVGGLVLHSSIANVSRAAAGSAALKVLKPAYWLGGQLGHAMVGKMSTRENLRALAAAGGTNLPIHLMGGRGANDDHLGLDRTGLDAYATGLGFTNTTTSVAPGDHMARSLHMLNASPHLQQMFGNQPAQQNLGLGPPPNMPLPQPPVQVDDDQQ